jgi:ABC-2 type transport system permease protein
VAGFLNTFDPATAILGPTCFLLIGAWVAGSSWADGNLITALLQGPTRLQTLLAQASAVAIAAVASVVLTFALSGVATEIVARSLPGAAPAAAYSFGSFGHLATALGAGLVLAATFGAIGWAVGHLLRNPGAAMATLLLWSLAVQPTLESEIAPGFHGLVLSIYDLLPGPAATSVAYLFGTATGYLGAPTPEGPHLSTPGALLVFAAYIAASLGIAAVLIKRRDVA